MGRNNKVYIYIVMKAGSLMIMLTACITLNAQQLVFNRLSELNLPTKECYNIMQDHEGLIWIGTDVGVCTFNGDSITACKIPEDIAAEACYGVVENKGQLLINYDGRTFLTYDRKTRTLATVPFTNKIDSAIPNKKMVIYQLVPIGDSLLYASTQSHAYKINTIRNTITTLAPFDTTYDLNFIYLEGTLVQVKSDLLRARQHILKSKRVTIAIKTANSTLSYTVQINSSSISWQTYVCNNKTGDSFFSLNNKLIKFGADNKLTETEVNGLILALYCDNDNDLWVGTKRGGVYYYKQSDLNVTPVISLPGLSVTGICEDYEKGVWCSTYEKSIFYCRNKHVVYFPDRPGLNRRLCSMRVIDGAFYCASLKSQLVRINSGNICEFKLKNTDAYINDVVKTGKGFLLGTDKGTYFCDSSFKNQELVTTGKKGMSRSASGGLTIGKDSAIMFSTYEVFLVNKGISSNFLYPDGRMPSVAYLPPKRSFLLVINNCLYQLSLDKTLKKIYVPNTILRKVRVDKDNNTWLISDNKLLLLDGKKNINYSALCHLENYKLLDVLTDRQHNLWVSTQTCLIKITRGNNSCKVRAYTTVDGLLSNTIMEHQTLNDKLYINSDEGLYLFPISDPGSSPAPKFHLNKLEINGKFRKLNGNSIELPYFENKLLFDFNVFSYTDIPRKKARIQYKFAGTGDKWEQSDQRKVTFDNLQPGDYTLTVKAISVKDVISEKTLSYYITIRPPLWKRWWFITILICGVAGVLYLLVSVRIKRVKKREAEKTRLNKLVAEYQMSALQAHMNPHFIFNAINSIQLYILDNETQVAYDYLAKFSKLMRTILENTRKRTISLKQELDALRAYIELEQMRFKNKFTSQIIMDPAINTDMLQIPPLLIQPYVENSIWHGLMPLKKKRPGILKVELAIRGPSLLIVIEDNGVGRKQGQKDRDAGVHRSAGMEITEQRITVLNAMPEFKNPTILIIDLYNNGEACGTRIEICLPLIKTDYE